MPFVLDNLSLKIKPGQYVAIVGKTGCGKSTLMRLLLGFETPQRGAVYFDGQDIAKLDLRSLRQNIGSARHPLDNKEVIIEKIILDVKEMQIGEGSIKPLSEADLDAVQGEAQSIGIFRWYCVMCDAKATKWYTTIDAASNDLAWEEHKQKTGHQIFEIEPAFFCR
jgi:ABC-type phosphate/phosphonate transport system ATPase subunit